MSDDTPRIEELEAKFTFLERHIEAQDTEFYKLSQRVEQLTKLVKKHEEQIKEFNNRREGEMPANEKPPHY